MKILFTAAIICVFSLVLFLSGRVTIRRGNAGKHEHAEPRYRELQGGLIQATIAGDNGSPTSAFPLQACQGDW
jgi:hypothetical protein